MTAEDGYDEEMLKVYQNMVIERHLIWQRRQAGEPGPWTTDSVLSNLKMTNMFRVLDPGSQFVLTDLLCEDPLDYLVRCVFYRITNLPKTWYAMKNMYAGRYPVASDFTRPGMADNLAVNLSKYRDAGNKIFSGAYIIVPNPGVVGSDKAVDAIALTKFFAEEKAPAFFAAQTQEERYHVLRSTKGLGRFLSMQILTDWGYAQEEDRENDFIVAGPGAVRGAAHLNSRLSSEDVIYDMAVEWHDHPIVNVNGHSLGLMNTQNTLCEFSKYVRERVTPRKTSPYKPAHPGRQPKPVLPAWMK